MPAWALSFSRSLIDFPAVVDLAVVLEDGAPRDMDHRSSNPVKPLAGAGAAAPVVDVRVTGVDVAVAGCDDDHRVFCAGLGDIVVANDWDCLLFDAVESAFSGVL